MTKTQKQVLIVSLSTSFITTFTASSLNLSVPAMAAEFHVSASAIGWIVTGYALAASIFTVPFGRLSDMTGRKRILVTGITCFGVFSVLAGISFSFPMVVVSRIMQGISSSMIFATNQAIVIQYFPEGERGRALGISIASTYSGLALGPVIGGFINQHFGWRYIFFLIVLICFFSLSVALKGLPFDGMKVRRLSWTDVKGNLLFMVMLFCTMYGLISWTLSAVSKILFGAGIGTGIIFVFDQKRSQSPVIKISMFKDIRYSLSNAATFLNYASTFAISYLLSIYLQVIMGYTSQHAGLILIVQPAFMALLSPVMGKLSDRVSPFKLATAGMGFCTVTLVMLIFLSKDTGIWYILLLLAVAGIGFSVFSSPNTNAIMSLVDKADVGVATAILNTMRNMGQNTCMAVITTVVAVRLGDTPLMEASPDALLACMKLLYLIFAIMCAIGVFFSMDIRGKR